MPFKFCAQCFLSRLFSRLKFFSRLFFSTFFPTFFSTFFSTFFPTFFTTFFPNFFSTFFLTFSPDFLWKAADAKLVTHELVEHHHVWTLSKQMSELEAPLKHWSFWNPTKEKNLSFYNDIKAQCSQSPN